MLDIFFDLLGYAIVAPFAYPYYKLFKLTKSIDASFQMPRSNAKPRQSSPNLLQSHHFLPHHLQQQLKNSIS